MSVIYKIQDTRYKMNAIQLALNFNAPPGLVHPLFVENYDWVDNRLRELYYEIDLDDELYAEDLFIEETWLPIATPTATPNVTPTPINQSYVYPIAYDIENQYVNWDWEEETPTVIDVIEDEDDDWEDYDEGYDSY